ncbi:hypothetical protein D3C78_1058890 [compost metagenome]
MQISGYDARRSIYPFTFPFNSDTVIRLSRSTGQTVVANMGIFFPLRLNTNRDVLTRGIRGDSPSILWRQVKGSNMLTFTNLPSDDKVSESTPAPRSFRSFTILFCFHTNESICDHTIGLGPCIYNFRCCRIAKHLPNRS